MKFTGKLISKCAIKPTNFVITAEFNEIIIVNGNAEETEKIIASATRRAEVDAEGQFFIDMPEPDERTGLVTLRATGADGITAGLLKVPEDSDGNNLDITVNSNISTEVDTSDNLTLGENRKYTGRVIDKAGNPAAADLVVVIWATSKGQEKPVAVSVTMTTAGGYFNGPWPEQKFSDAYIAVDGKPLVPVVLEDEFIPLRLLAVLDKLPQPKEKDDDCKCAPTPPRAPDNIDIAENPEAFASDIGGCVDFTIPNRTVDEVIYQAVVRTTQPALNPPDPPNLPEVPPGLVDRFAALASVRPADLKIFSDIPDNETATETAVRARSEPLTLSSSAAIRSGDVATVINSSTELPDVIKPVLANAEVLIPGIDLNGMFNTASNIKEHDVATVVLSNRAALGKPIELASSVLSALVSDNRTLSPKRLLEAEHASVVHRFRNTLRRITKKGTGRFDLTESRQIDWDEIPERYQATTIAHGHLLSMKQIWRSDGYSLGDLLYSLPLAPGQQKLISVLDWDRSEVAARRASRDVHENLSADLSHDRDISDVIRATLSERMTAQSHADVKAVGGGIGGFIGPVVFGAAGGVSSAGSKASQTSARLTAGVALNRVRDRTMQAASATRSQRATVVQTAREGEAVRAQTEVIANYNHCHAITVEYFEVLRHLQVSQELAHVQECLFIPFSISAFDSNKALRWREPLVRGLRDRRLRSAFDALQRMRDNWENADYPQDRYADDRLRHIDGEFRMRISLPKPADDDDDNFVEENWSAYEDNNLLGQDSAENVWERFFGGIKPQHRQSVWDARIVPAIAQRLIAKLALRLYYVNGNSDLLTIDSTLVSQYRSERPHLVSLRVEGALPQVTRAIISRVEILFQGVSTLPAGAEIRIDSATINYRTDHYRGYLFRNRRVLNDLSLRESGDDTVQISTPLNLREKRNPRKRDLRRAEKLLEHLNEHIEHYHRAIWIQMDPNRRFLLLDGFEAPNASGRSVASVVENRIIGIVGNSLVMPVAPGQKLDPTYIYAESTLEDLRNLYAVEAAPKMRISLPTPGVFAESVMGKCNSCEEKDDNLFWRFEEEPIPDTPTPIESLSTNSRRRQPPSLTPDAFADALVKLQQAPKAPDPTGLSAAVEALGNNNIFKDLTGLIQNQANASQAFKATMKVSQEFAARGAALAQQRHLSRELDHNLDAIKNARDKQMTDKGTAQSLTEDLFRRAIGEKSSSKDSPTKDKAVKKLIERSTASKKGSVTINKPSGSVEIETSNAVGNEAIDIRIDPPLSLIQQRNKFVCWAAGGAMMRFWQVRTTSTVEDFLDELGGDWRARFEANQGLSAADFRAFISNLNVVEEGPQSYTPQGLARLLNSGPVLTVGDDGVANNKLIHIRIVTGMVGDGTASDSRVIFADSLTGTEQNMNFIEFANKLESKEASDTGLGVFHF